MFLIRFRAAENAAQKSARRDASFWLCVALRAMMATNTVCIPF